MTQDNTTDKPLDEKLKEGQQAEQPSPEKGAAEQESASEEQYSEELSPEEQLQQELTESKEQMLRMQAEMQNLRRRTERDIENAHKFALDKFANELLPVVDNLERALSAITPEDDSQKAIAEGVDLTLKSFIDVLSRFKLEQIDPAGQPFDPELHQAMTQVPNPELEPNTVMDVFQKGYSLNGRLLRPAMVVVSKAP